jgi:hypothetical protein
VPPYAVLSYLGCRWWVFANQRSGLKDERA